MSDFFETHAGNAPALASQSVGHWRRRDFLYDWTVLLGGRMARIRRKARSGPRRRILIVGIEVPSRAADIHETMKRLRHRSRHDVVVSVVPMGPRGKFENIDHAIAAASEPLGAFDWLVVTDDDIAFAKGFLDDLIALAEVADLSVAMPAHAFESHTSYAITKRHRGSLVRETAFVEIGPLTLIRADAFETFVPFPASRWCYGIDVLWGELAERLGLKIGIIDGTPVRHLRPVAAAYDIDEAIEEGRALLRRFNVTRSRDEIFERNRITVPVV